MTKFVSRRKFAPITGGRPKGVQAGAVFARRALLGMMERKVIDTASADYSISTTGSVTLVNGVAQGSDFTNRIGRKWTMTAVQLSGYIHPNGSSDNVSGTHARLLLIYDSQPNGALPSISDIFTASSSNAFINLNNRDRFKIVYSHSCALGPYDNSISHFTDNTVSLVDVYKKVNLDVINDGTTAAIGDIQTGSLLLVTIGDLATPYLFTGAVRVRFVDA